MFPPSAKVCTAKIEADTTTGTPSATSTLGFSSVLDNNLAPGSSARGGSSPCGSSASASGWESSGHCSWHWTLLGEREGHQRCDPCACAESEMAAGAAKQRQKMVQFTIPRRVNAQPCERADHDASTRKRQRFPQRRSSASLWGADSAGRSYRPSNFLKRVAPHTSVSHRHTLEM